jgi:hypothetical protein
MAVFLDYPLADETLFGVIARYLRDDRVARVDQFCFDLLGERCNLTTGLTYQLEHLAKETRIVWGMSSDEIRHNLTLYPYYAAFWSEVQREAVLRCCVLGMRTTYDRVSPSLSTMSPRLGIRHCELCWQQDRRDGLPCYWRRIHQLPGVVVCLHHGIPLCTNGTGNWSALLKIARQFGPGRLLDFGLTDRQLVAHVEMSKCSALVLRDGFRQRRFVELSERVDSAKAYGYAAGKSIDVERMATDVEQFFGRNYVHEILPIARSGNGWVKRCFIKGWQDSNSALPEMLIDLFLRRCEDRVVNSGVPVCPAAPACEELGHRLVIRGNAGRRVHYFCACGFSFYYECDPETGRVSLTPTQDGPDMALTSAILCSRGYSVADIARTFDLEESEVEGVLRRRIEVRPWRLRTERAKFLASWIELVNRCGSADAALVENGRLWRSIGLLRESLPDGLRPAVAKAEPIHRRTRGERYCGV